MRSRVSGLAVLAFLAAACGSDVDPPAGTAVSSSAGDASSGAGASSSGGASATCSDGEGNAVGDIATSWSLPDHLGQMIELVGSCGKVVFYEEGSMW